MKKQRRNPHQRAFNKGIQSGRKGHGSEECPHKQIDIKAEWLSGWRHGHHDYLAGYISEPE